MIDGEHIDIVYTDEAAFADLVNDERRAEARQEREDATYDAWLRDNRTGLAINFVTEQYPDEFAEYCREAYREFGGD